MRRLLALAVVIAAAPLAPSAEACGCDEPAGPIVAKGESRHGVPWRVKASRDGPDDIVVDFSVLKPGYSDAGHGTSLHYPIHPAFVMTATTGSDLSRFPEGDVSGVTSAAAVRLMMKMSRGRPVTIRPRMAPKAVRDANPWLAGLRFYDRFFSDRRSPRRITAYDAAGRVLDRLPLR